MNNQEQGALDELLTAATTVAAFKTSETTVAKTDAAAPAAIIEKILPNGMKVILKPTQASETVAVKLFVRGGQTTEQKPGVAALVSQLLMQGTANRSAEAISKELETRGMDLSVGVNDDFMEVSGHATKEDLGELFLVMSDILNNPLFDETEIKKEKDQMQQAIHASRENPSSIALENLSLNLYPNHPYGNIGKRVEASLPNITRDDLVAYFKANFKPENMVAVAVGNYNPETLDNYLDSAFTTSQAGYQKTPAVVSTGAVNNQLVPSLPKIKLVTEEKAQQAATTMAMGWLVPPVSSGDYVPLKVINAMLGTGMSSRLFVGLREKQGLAYVVSSFYPSRKQDSRFVMYIGTDPKNRKTVETGFNHEIARLKEEPITEAELTEAKSKLRGSFALEHETNSSQAYYLGLFEILGVGYHYDVDYPKRIEEVTASDIQRAAREYFSKPYVLSVVEPPAKPE